MTTFYIACDDENTIKGAFLNEQAANVFPSVREVEEEFSAEQEQLYCLEYTSWNAEIGEIESVVRLYETRADLTEALIALEIMEDNKFDGYDGEEIDFSAVADNTLITGIIFGETGADRITLISVIQ